MAEKYHIWFDFVRGRASTMLEVIENVHFATDCLRRYNLIHLRHVASSIHFTLMIDL